MAETVYYVDTDVVGGAGDGSSWANAYASLNDAENARDADITGGNAVAFNCRGTAADTAAAQIIGWTTNADSYVRVYTEAANRHDGKWNTSKYRLSVTDAVALQLREDYVRLDGIQIEVVSPTANAKYPLQWPDSITATNNASWISNCIIRGHGHGTYTQIGVYAADADVNLWMWNTIVYGVGAITGNRAVQVVAGVTSNIYSCTIIGGAYGFLQATSGTATIKNTYIGGSATEDFSSSATLAKTNCASEDSSADDTGATETQSNCIVSVDCTTAGVTFVDPANGDFRVADTDSALYGAGATLSDDPPGSTALGVDIIGTSRS